MVPAPYSLSSSHVVFAIKGPIRGAYFFVPLILPGFGIAPPYATCIPIGSIQIGLWSWDAYLGVDGWFARMDAPTDICSLVQNTCGVALGFPISNDHRPQAYPGVHVGLGWLISFRILGQIVLCVCVMRMMKV